MNARKIKQRKHRLAQITAALAFGTITMVALQEVTPVYVSAASQTVISGDDLVRALATAKPGDVITIGGNGFTVTPTQVQNNTLVIPNGVIIEGEGGIKDLTLRGINVEANNATLHDLNVTVIKDGSVEGSITATGGTLTLDNVTTLINAQQSNVRPILITKGGNLTVVNGTDETKFDKIIDKGTTPTNINLESSNIVVTNGIELQATTTVKTASNFTSKFAGPGSVIFSKAIISDIEVSNVANLTASDGANVKLKDGLQSYGDVAVITNKITVEQGATLNATNNILTVKEISGTGDYHMQHDGKLEVDTISESVNIQIQKSDANYTEHLNKVYIQANTVSALPVVTFNNDPSGMKLNKQDTIWVLEKSDEVDKSYLKDEMEHSGQQVEPRIFTPDDTYNKASKETQSAFDEALTKANEVYDDPNATQSDINAAQDALKAAYEALTPDANPQPAPVETTAAPTTVAPTTAAPTTVAPTTAAPTTAAPTTVAPTTAAPTTAAPTTAAPTTAAPTTVAPTTAAPTTSIVVKEEVVTSIVTEAPVTRIETEAPVTRIVTAAPVTQVVSDEQSTNVVTEAPVTRVETEAPVTRIVTEELSTKVVTEIVPVTEIITEAPVTRIVTAAPVITSNGLGVVDAKPAAQLPEIPSPTTAPTTVAPVTEVAVTAKGEAVTAAPKLEAKLPTNPVFSRKDKAAQANSSVSSVKAHKPADTKVLPKTGDVATKVGLLGGIVLTISGMLALGRKNLKNNDK